MTLLSKVHVKSYWQELSLLFYIVLSWWISKAGKDFLYLIQVCSVGDTSLNLDLLFQAHFKDLGDCKNTDFHTHVTPSHIYAFGTGANNLAGDSVQILINSCVLFLSLLMVLTVRHLISLQWIIYSSHLVTRVSDEVVSSLVKQMLSYSILATIERKERFLTISMVYNLKKKNMKFFAVFF